MHSKHKGNFDSVLIEQTLFGFISVVTFNLMHVHRVQLMLLMTIYFYICVSGTNAFIFCLFVINLSS